MERAAKYIKVVKGSAELLRKICYESVIRVILCIVS